MRNNAFIPPKVATPQQYFLNNAPNTDPRTHPPNTQHQPTYPPNSQPQLQSAPQIYLEQASSGHYHSQNHPISPPTQYQGNSLSTPNQIPPAFMSEPGKVDVQYRPVVRPVSPGNIQSRPLMKVASMKDSAVSERSQGRKITFTENLVQQIPVESWKKENMENTFGYMPPPRAVETPNNGKMLDSSNNLQGELPNSGAQFSGDKKQEEEGKGKSQKCCLLF